jgi:hypothetical protein
VTRRQPITVYRVQDASGFGPDYMLGGVLDDILEDQGLQPDPGEDFEEHVESLLPHGGKHSMPSRTYSGDANIKHRYFFGFPSEEAARSWYGTKGLVELARRGFVLTKVPVAEVHYSTSGRQIIFRPVAKRSKRKRS